MFIRIWFWQKWLVNNDIFDKFYNYWARSFKTSYSTILKRAYGSVGKRVAIWLVSSERIGFEPNLDLQIFISTLHLAVYQFASLFCPLVLHTDHLHLIITCPFCQSPWGDRQNNVEHFKFRCIHLLLSSHKMDFYLKFGSENVFFRCTSLGYSANGPYKNWIIWNRQDKINESRHPR